MPVVFDQVSYAYDAPKRKRGLFGSRGGEEADARTSWALCDVSFELADGEFLGVAGHTGSGKSTLVQHMNGLLHPTRGRVLVDGRDLSEKGAAEVARSKVGVVFQYPENQLFAATVAEDVAFGPRNMGLGPDEVEARVARALEVVGLDVSEVGERSPFELSGGQQRRVAFAGVLAMEPAVLVLDEPAAGLDPKARADFLALVKRLHEGGRSVVMVSHSMDDLARLSERVLVLDEGRVFALGAPAQVFSRDAELREIGLGVPAAQAAARALQDAGLRLERELYDEKTLALDVARLWRERERGRSEQGRGHSEAAGAPGAQRGSDFAAEAPDVG